MIRNFRLRNWRSYEDLNLQLEPGTTFVVAPNGVGKTSLVYGLSWAVFGDQSGIDPTHSIRAGTEAAEVNVEIELPKGHRLVIHRVIRHQGSPKSWYEFDGQRRSSNFAQSELESALGIELPIASRLAMMLGGGNEAAQTALKLEGHLHHAFGVTNLLRATENAESVAKEASKRRASLRATTKQRMQNRVSIEEKISELEEQVSRLVNRAAELAQIRDAAEVQRSSVERDLALVDQRERYVHQRRELISAIERHLERALSYDDDAFIANSLYEEIQFAQGKVAQITERTIQLRSIGAAADHALELLKLQDANCPTCMRPLADDEKAVAVAVHLDHQHEAQAQVERLESDRVVHETHLKSISSLLAQLEALQSVEDADARVDIKSRSIAETRYRQAVTALDEHNLKLGGARSELGFLKNQIATDDEVEAQEQALREAYVREAAALASMKALRNATNHVVSTRIEPLTNELRKRWKHLFTSNGLTFSSDGTIARLRDGRELPWDTLSGGERTWARIVTHLIVMGTTTSLPFAWFDEPLEHLDPRLRHAVAATLATATAGGSPRQLLVTTYEHAIAKQLADAVEGATVVSLRESEEPIEWSSAQG